MIKRIKGMDPEFQEYAAKVESEINRGLSSVCVLSIINEYGDQGVHGYQILKDLEERTNQMLIIEEGTLYPLLRKLQHDGIIKSYREKEGRRRKYFSLTKYGKKVFNYLAGFYSKLTEAIGSLFDVKVDLKSDRYLYCPMCANKIDLSSGVQKFCDACGHHIEDEIKSRGI
ncbi:MAG: PadR family transcriptional regulator [Promethearchaeota archaeon]|nr:MAG: PadR family transcriptional regulator [Candidatus Lokiarchaeota archaeon]